MKSLMLFLLFSGTMMAFAVAWNVVDPHMETAIEFTNAPWEDVLAKAKVENKIIFLDIYASWCGPCKMLKRTTFTDKEVGAFFNTHFVNVTLDGEQGEGLVMSKRYQLQAYPTLLFIFPDGSVKREAVGYHSPKKLLEVAQEVSGIDAMDNN